MHSINLRFAAVLLSATTILGIEAGVAFPFSSFRSTSSDNQHPGFAIPGGMVQAEYLKLGSGITGFSIELGYAWIGFDKDAFAKAYNLLLPPETPDVQAGHYVMIQASGGFAMYKNLTTKTRFSATPSIGVTAEL